MAANNNCNFVGRVGNDPAEDVRHTKSGMAVVELSLAVDSREKDDQGHYVTEWVKIRFWDKRAETVVEYVKKGDMLAVSSRLKTEKWETANGEKRYKSVFEVDDFRFVGGKRSDEDGAAKPQSQRRPGANQSQANAQKQRPYGGGRPTQDDFIDDDEFPPF